MKPDKLSKLLQEMETRLRRAERYYAGSHSIAQQLASVKAEVRRQQSKVDSLRIADIDGLERQIKLLQIPADDLGLANLIAGLKIGLNQLGPDDVLDAIPGQKLAAFQFGFEGNRVVVIDQPLRTRERERDIAVTALEGVIEQGKYVQEQLALSNCSPRLRDAFGMLQGKLEARTNTIQIGMFNQTCGRVLGADVDELSSTLFELLRSHVEMVAAAVAQFEDWRIFCENAVNLDRDSISALSRSTLALARDLKSSSEASREVSDALDTVAAWADDDAADKRDFFALASTLQNLWSLVTKSALAKEVASEGRKLAAKAIIGFLLAATSAAALAAFGKIPDAAWIETTVSYFKSGGGQASGAQ